MATLDSILGKFTEVKNELVNFISSTKEEIKGISDDNLKLALQIKENECKADAKVAEIQTATRSIKQIDKLLWR